METTNIVFDIGGSKTRVARIDGEKIANVTIFETGQTPEEGIPLLVEKIKEVAGTTQIGELCGGMAGIVKRGTIHICPSLPDWNGTDVVRKLQGAFDGATTTLFNDVELIAMGEYHYGAGARSSNMVYMTVSTGIGAARLLHGQISRGQYNAEIGHQILDGDQEFEAFAAGRAVAAKYDMHPKDISDPAILTELAEYLATGLYNLTLFWSPKVIILGGSMITGQNAIPLDQAQVALEKRVLRYYPSAPILKKAELGEESGLYGAMSYIARRIN